MPNKHHYVGIPWNGSAGRHEREVDVRIQPERIGGVEVGDAGQHRCDDAPGTGTGHAALPLSRSSIVSHAAFALTRDRRGVFRRQSPGCGQPVNETEARPPGAPFDDREAVGEQRRVAAKLVHGESDDEGRVLRVQDRPRADQGRDHAAAVDVADEADGDAGRPREAHVGNVVRPQVHLRRTAGSLDENEVVVGRQALEALQDRCPDSTAGGVVPHRVQGAGHVPLHDHLRAPIGLRLQEHRVEIAVRFQPGGPRLQGLRAADLAAVGADRGVVGHVLRLERRYADAAPPGESAQSGDDDGLADIRAGALNHEGARPHPADAPTNRDTAIEGPPLPLRNLICDCTCLKGPRKNNFLEVPVVSR